MSAIPRILCVYRTSRRRRFIVDDVHRLATQVRRGMGDEPHRFTVLTDAHPAAFDRSLVDDVIELRNGWRGWWAKMELFRLPGPWVYFDLDTVIVGPIAKLLQIEGNLAFLKGFKPRPPIQTGMIVCPDGYNPDWILPLFEEDLLDEPQYFGGTVQTTPQMIMRDGKVRGDQEWFVKQYEEFQIRDGFQLIQDSFSGIYSYKYDVRPKRNKLPEDARVICFHGTPRPRGVSLLPWMIEHWGGNHGR